MNQIQIHASSRRNTSIEQYYNYVGENNSANGFFYLNNFECLTSSLVTLFELTGNPSYYRVCAPH